MASSVIEHLGLTILHSPKEVEEALDKKYPRFKELNWNRVLELGGRGKLNDEYRQFSSMKRTVLEFADRYPRFSPFVAAWMSDGDIETLMREKEVEYWYAFPLLSEVLLLTCQVLEEMQEAAAISSSQDAAMVHSGTDSGAWEDLFKQ